MREKLRKQTKSSWVLNRIRADILNGTYHPGQKLQMEELKNQYQVGLSPLREALSRLVSTGLIGLEEQCGFYVSRVSLEELRDLYTLRSQIEKQAVKLAMKHGDSEWEAQILASLHTLNKYLDDASQIDFNEFEKLQKKFNLSVISACGSPWMIKVINLLDDQALRYRSLCIKNGFNHKNIINTYIQKNKLLVDSIIARKKEKALEILQQIWNESIESIAETLK